MDNESKKPERIQRLTLTKPEHVRKYLARIAKDVQNGDIDLSTARVLITASEAILKGIRIDEHEKRINDLEERLENPEKFEKLDKEADFTDFLAYKKNKEGKK